MIIYNVSRQNVALSTTNDYMTIISGATRSTLVLEIDAQGGGNSSVAGDVGLFAVTTAGVTGGGAIVPQPVERPNMTGTTPALSYSGTVNTTWSTQPVVVTTPVHPFGLNANGQRYYWRCLPNLSNALVLPGGANAAGSLSVRGINGTNLMSARLQLAEL